MENRQNIFLCWLSQIPTVGKVTVGRLLSECGDPEEVYRLDRGRTEEFVRRKVLTQSQACRLRQWQTEPGHDPFAIYEEMERRGIRCVLYAQKEYPDRLRYIADPPGMLYARGALPSPDAPAVGIVGARLCSDYGRYAARQFASGLARAGVQIISGMALGIDGISHKAALDAGGKTFAVLGCGVDVCYPKENRDIYDRLWEAGGILSEYPPGTAPCAGLFPPRNRIISGLSDLLLVVEARRKSGTLITVDQALEQGKEVYALPGRVTDALSCGCNNLIRQGAGVAMSPEELTDIVFELWGQKGRGGETEAAGAERCADAEVSKRAGSARSLTPEEKRVYDCLTEEGQTLDSLMGKTGISPGGTSAALTGLCICGLAVCTQGRYRKRDEWDG